MAIEEVIRLAVELSVPGLEPLATTPVVTSNGWSCCVQYFGTAMLNQADASSSSPRFLIFFTPVYSHSVTTQDQLRFYVTVHINMS